MICRRRISRRRTPASRNHRMISVDSTTCICCWTKVELSNRRISCLPFAVLSANQSIAVDRPSRVCIPVPINGEPVVQYRRPPVVLLLAHNVRSQLYCCTAVLRVLLANKGDWTDDAAIALFTVPLLVWSSYTSVTSAQNNRNIRLDIFTK